MEQGKKIPLVVVCGPTASGKTNMAIDLALRLKGEIISADSMQIYKQLDIGTAKPSVEERRGVVHHMLDIVDPRSQYSVADYCLDAGRCIEDVFFRGKLPILVGGTGLYINSLIEGTLFGQVEKDCDYRKTLLDLAQKEGKEKLHRLLQKIDPNSADRLHINDTTRIIRALEINEKTGLTVEQYNLKSKREESLYNVCMIGLTPTDRQILYDRINKRVDTMMQKGLLLEVENLLKQGIDRDTTAMQAIGYKEFIACLEGEISLEEAVNEVKQASRRYAKRQLTWFRANKNIFWIDSGEGNEQLSHALEWIGQTKVLENVER